MHKLVLYLLAISGLLVCSLSSQAQEKTLNHVIAAREYLKMDSTRLAKLELDSALAITPKDAQANVMMGDLMNENGEYLKALMSYDKAILADGSSADLYRKRAALHIQLNNHYAYVISDFDQAIRLEPTNIEHYKAKAAYQANSISPESSKPDFDKAAYTISLALVYAKDDAELYYLRSKYMFGDEQFLAALSDINHAIQLNANNDLYLAQRGYINFMISNYRQAYADYSRAINIDNKVAEYYEFRGHAFYNMEKYIEAYNDYSVGIDLLIAQIAAKKTRLSINDPLNKQLGILLLYRGMSLVQDNKPYDACDDFERADLMGESKARNYMRKYCN